MVIRINEVKTLSKHISCNFQSQFDGWQFASNQNWNNDKNRCYWENPIKHCVCIENI